MRLRERYPFALALALVAGLVIGQATRADGPNRVGLVVDYGNGQVATACIAFDEPSISGMEVLLRAGRSLVTGFRGGTVCQVDGVGCPDGNNCWCECPGTPCRYWIYYYLSDGQWEYSGLGATARQVHNGDVEGWVWGEGQLNAGGAMPPLLTFDEICVPPKTPTPTDTPPPPTATFTPPPTNTPIVLSLGPTATEPPPPTRTPTPKPSKTPTSQLPTPSPVVPTATAPAQPTPVPSLGPVSGPCPVPTPLPTLTTRPAALSVPTPPLARSETGQSTPAGAGLQTVPPGTASLAGAGLQTVPPGTVTPAPVLPTSTPAMPASTPEVPTDTVVPASATVLMESTPPSPTPTFVRIQLPMTPEPTPAAQSAGRPLGYATFAAIVVGLVALLLVSSGRRPK